MIYTALSLSETPTSASIAQRMAPEAPGLNLDSPSIAAMTNFAHECPITVSPERRIDDPLQDMIRTGVRALLVLEEGQVNGLITSYDIQGERPILSLQSPACHQDACAHRDVRVVDIMTPLAQMLALDRSALLVARVGDLVKTFQAHDCTQLLVLEARSGGAPRPCGLISTEWLTRQVGVPLDMASSQVT
ncbi:MAG: CBS domain-containing protein [Rubrivivax sp.]